MPLYDIALRMRQEGPKNYRPTCTILQGIAHSTNGSVRMHLHVLHKTPPLTCSRSTSTPRLMSSTMRRLRRWMSRSRFMRSREDREALPGGGAEAMHVRTGRRRGEQRRVWLLCADVQMFGHESGGCNYIKLNAKSMLTCIWRFDD